MAVMVNEVLLHESANYIAGLYNKIIRVNKYSDQFDIIKIEDEEENDVKNISSFKEWVKQFIEDDRLHHDDIYYLRYFLEERERTNTPGSICYTKRVNKRWCAMCMDYVPTEGKYNYIFVKNLEEV